MTPIEKRIAKESQLNHRLLRGLLIGGAVAFGLFSWKAYQQAPRPITLREVLKSGPRKFEVSYSDPLWSRPVPDAPGHVRRDFIGSYPVILLPSDFSSQVSIRTNGLDLQWRNQKDAHLMLFECNDVDTTTLPRMGDKARRIELWYDMDHRSILCTRPYGEYCLATPTFDKKMRQLLAAIPATPDPPDFTMNETESGNFQVVRRWEEPVAHHPSEVSASPPESPNPARPRFIPMPEPTPGPPPPPPPKPTEPNLHGVRADVGTSLEFR